MSQITCLHCNQPLEFKYSRGWVHSDTQSLYVMKCKDCGYKGGNYVKCPACGSKNYVDDHCALPKSL